MAKPYSMDLRERVVAAVDGGMSCHSAAKRLGSRRVRRSNGCGVSVRRGARPGKIGGHKPNILSGSNRDWMLKRVATDFTLRGLVAELAERGVKVDYVQVWRFVHAEGLSFRKKRAARRTTPARDRPATRAMEDVSGSA